MANVTASMENVAKTTLWQSNESSYLKFDVSDASLILRGGQCTEISSCYVLFAYLYIQALCQNIAFRCVPKVFQLNLCHYLTWGKVYKK